MEPRTAMAMALTMAAQRDGRLAMDATRWAHVLSLGLGWMAPAQARAFVARAQAAGILGEQEGLLALLEPTAGAPIGFRPDPALEPGQSQDSFSGWLAMIEQRTGRPRAAVLGDVAAAQQRMGGWLTADVAVLMVARDTGLDVRRGAAGCLEAFMRQGSAARPAGGGQGYANDASR